MPGLIYNAANIIFSPFVGVSKDQHADNAQDEQQRPKLSIGRSILHPFATIHDITGMLNEKALHIKDQYQEKFFSMEDRLYASLDAVEQRALDTLSARKEEKEREKDVSDKDVEDVKDKDVKDKDVKDKDVKDKDQSATKQDKQPKLEKTGDVEKEETFSVHEERKSDDAEGKKAGKKSHDKGKHPAKQHQQHQQQRKTHPQPQQQHHQSKKQHIKLEPEPESDSFSQDTNEFVEDENAYIHVETHAESSKLLPHHASKVPVGKAGKEVSKIKQLEADMKVATIFYNRAKENEIFFTKVAETHRDLLGEAERLAQESDERHKHAEQIVTAKKKEREELVRKEWEAEKQRAAYHEQAVHAENARALAHAEALLYGKKKKHALELQKRHKEGLESAIAQAELARIEQKQAEIMSERTMVQLQLVNQKPESVDIKLENVKIDVEVATENIQPAHFESISIPEIAEVSTSFTEVLRKKRAGEKVDKSHDTTISGVAVHKISLEKQPYGGRNMTTEKWTAVDTQTTAVKSGAEGETTAVTTASQVAVMNVPVDVASIQADVKTEDKSEDKTESVGSTLRDQEKKQAQMKEQGKRKTSLHAPEEHASYLDIDVSVGQDDNEDEETNAEDSEVSDSEDSGHSDANAMQSLSEQDKEKIKHEKKRLKRQRQKERKLAEKERRESEGDAKVAPKSQPSSSSGSKASSAKPVDAGETKVGNQETKEGSGSSSKGSSSSSSSKKESETTHHQKPGVTKDTGSFNRNAEAQSHTQSTSSTPAEHVPSVHEAQSLKHSAQEFPGSSDETNKSHSSVDKEKQKELHIEEVKLQLSQRLEQSEPQVHHARAQTFERLPHDQDFENPQVYGKFLKKDSPQHDEIKRAKEELYKHPQKPHEQKHEQPEPQPAKAKDAIHSAPDMKLPDPDVFQITEDELLKGQKVHKKTPEELEHEKKVSERFEHQHSGKAAQNVHARSHEGDKIISMRGQHESKGQRSE